jgi:hypothetical protein
VTLIRPMYVNIRTSLLRRAAAILVARDSNHSIWRHPTQPASDEAPWVPSPNYGDPHRRLCRAWLVALRALPA